MMYRIRILLLIICCFAVKVVAGTPSSDSAYRERFIAESAASLKQMISDNARNIANGAPEKNRYLLVLGDSNYIDQLNVVQGYRGQVGVPILTTDQQQQVNDVLKKINGAADNKRLGVYVLVFNSWYLNLNTEIPKNAKVSDLYDIKGFTEDDLKNRIWDEIKGLSDVIFEKANFQDTNFESRVGVVLGREICFLGKEVSRVFMTGETYARGFSQVNLDKLNANLVGKVPGLSDPYEYLTKYPPALYAAFREKYIPPKPQYQFKPEASSFFGKVLTRVSKDYKSKDPLPFAAGAAPIIDYSGGLSDEEKKKVYDGLTGFSGEYAFQAKIFITSTYTTDEVIAEVKKYVKEPANPQEIVIWVQLDVQGEVSYEYGYGSAIPHPESAGTFVKMLAYILPKPTMNPLADMFDAIAGLIGHLEIPERYYNPDAQHFNALPGLVFGNTVGTMAAMPIEPLLLGISQGWDRDKYSLSRVNFGFTCGIWNGAVDFLVGIPNALNMLAGGDKWSEMKEAFGKLGKIYDAKGAMGVAGVFGDLITKAHTGNPCKVGHTIGVDIVNLATIYFSFAKVGAAAQIGKLMELIDPFTYALKGVVGISKFAFTLSGKTVAGLYKAGRIIVRMHLEDGKQIIQYVLDASEKFRPLLFPRDGLVLAGIDGQKWVVNPAYLNAPEELGSYKLMSVLKEEGEAAGKAADEAFVTLSKNGEEELAVARKAESLGGKANFIIPGLSNIELGIFRNEAFKLIDYVAGIIGKKNRPLTGCVLMDGEKFITGLSYKLEKLKLGELPSNLHPVIKAWFENPPVKNGKDLLTRLTHGKCAEPQALSDWLRKVERETQRTITTVEEAREALKGTKSIAFVTALDANNATRLPIGQIREACISCNPFLEYFGVQEIHLDLNIIL